MSFIEGSIANDTQALPLQRLIESTMRGNAEAQAQAQVKDVAGKQTAAAAKLQITMTADPDDPGNPFVHIKNAKADQLNQTQGRDIREAYDAPHQNVDAAVARMKSPQPAGQFEGDALRSVGYKPFATDKTAADLQTYAQDYRAQRDLGESVIKAAVKAAIMRTGAWNRDEIATELDRQGAAANARAFKAVAEPVIAEQDRQTRLDQQSAAQSATEDRLLRSQRDAEAKQINAQKRSIINGTDFSLIDPSEWDKTIDDQNTTGVPFTDQERAIVRRKAAQDVNKAFLDYTDTKKDTFALGNQPTWEAAKAAFGHALTPEQDRIGRARWQAAHTYAVRKAADDTAQQELRAARLDAIQARLENASREKPIAIGRSELKDMAASELISRDPSTIKNYDEALAAKEAMLQREIAAHTDKRDKANVDAKAILSTPEGRRRWGWETPLADAQFTAKTYNRHLSEAQAELQQVQAAREARKQGKAPTATPTPAKAAPGTLKRVNGKLVYQP